MMTAKPTSRSKYRGDLRQSQAVLTRQRIERATAALLGENGTAEGITFRAVAERAGVAEMTVYRHFPTRDVLLGGLWHHLADEMSSAQGMPSTAAALLGEHEALFADFDRIAPQIVASLTTAQGRRMRASFNAKRRKAYLAIIDEVAPDLTAARRLAAAALIQLLHSAHAWDSLRQQWSMGGRAAGNATRWAIELLIDAVKSDRVRTQRPR